MVRRAATSLTLSFGSLRYKSCYSISSPFHLVDHQASITDDPDLLRPVSQTSFMPQPDLGAMKRLFTELPNISRLTIIQLKESDEEVFPPFRLWPVMEHYARQLTSFDFHYLYYGLPPAYGQPRDIREYEFNRAVHSANFHRLLSLINYGMPQLRHLLINSGSAIFEADPIRPNVPVFRHALLGSLYLPVLRRLASFSFKTDDNEDVLIGSLKKFAGGGGETQCGALKLRLASVPRSIFTREMKGQFWKTADNLRLLLNRLDYLFVNQLELRNIITFLPPLASSLRYLHLTLYNKPTDILPLFTALSSLPLLTRLHLNLLAKLMGNPVPADLPLLPPLPSVTSLSLQWPFHDPNHFGPVLQPARVFPALQKLTILGVTFEGCAADRSGRYSRYSRKSYIYSSECLCRGGEQYQLIFGWTGGSLPTPFQCIRPALKASLMQYPPGAAPLINLDTEGGRKWFTVEEL